MRRSSVKIRYILRLTVSSLLIILMCLISTSCTSDLLIVNDVSISVDSIGFHYPNCMQDFPSKPVTIDMQVIDDNLYLYIPVNHAVYIFGNNGVSQMENMLIRNWYSNNDQVVDFGNGYMYIERYHTKKYSLNLFSLNLIERNYPKTGELLCYNLVTGEMTNLLPTENPSPFLSTFDENGRFYAAVGNTPGPVSQYQAIEGNELLNLIVSNPDIRSGSVYDVLEAYNAYTKTFSESQLENVIASMKAYKYNIRESHQCILYPREKGWLLYVSAKNAPLWYISFDGTVSTLFEAEGIHSYSSFNVYGDQAYFSFMRFEKRNDTWDYYLDPYENDTLTGTYQIDLTDFTMTKINDKSYESIFILDANSILTVDYRDGVYQLDTNGRLINTLVSPRKE